jgi:hypothetical protein
VADVADLRDPGIARARENLMTFLAKRQASACSRPPLPITEFHGRKPV